MKTVWIILNNIGGELDVAIQKSAEVEADSPMFQLAHTMARIISRKVRMVPPKRGSQRKKEKRRAKKSR